MIIVTRELSTQRFCLLATGVTKSAPRLGSGPRQSPRQSPRHPDSRTDSRGHCRRQPGATVGVLTTQATAGVPPPDSRGVTCGLSERQLGAVAPTAAAVGGDSMGVMRRLSGVSRGVCRGVSWGCRLMSSRGIATLAMGGRSKRYRERPDGWRPNAPRWTPVQHR